MKDEMNGNIINIGTKNKLNHYVYSFGFSADRKLTHDEIMKISKVGLEIMRKAVFEQTEIDTRKHNQSSGVEER